MSGGWGTGSVHDTMTRSPAERERIRAELAARDAEITAAWVAGESAEKIARRYRLSHNRISQIVHGRPALRAARDRQRHAQEDQKRRRALAWSTQHPGTPIGQGAALLGLSETKLKQLLAERADLHSTPPPAPTPRFSDDQVHHALTVFLAEGGRRRRDYDQLSHARQWPSSSTIITRHGSWTAALASAGYHTTPQTRPQPHLHRRRPVAMARRFRGRNTTPMDRPQTHHLASRTTRCPESSPDPPTSGSLGRTQDRARSPLHPTPVRRTTA